MKFHLDKAKRLRRLLGALAVATSLAALEAGAAEPLPPLEFHHPDAAVVVASPSLPHVPGVPQIKPLARIKLPTTPAKGPLPQDWSTDLFTAAKVPDAGKPTSRNWERRELTWAPSEMVHQPLYFDETPLERYGQTVHRKVQPFVSGAHFLGTFPLVPFQLLSQPPRECVYTLGLHRPGSPTPCLRQKRLH